MRKLSRRTFFQIGAAGAAGIILGDGIRFCLNASEAQEWSPAVAKMGELIPTTCAMCPAGCGLLCSLDGDELKGIFGNPHHPENRGKMCARGVAGLNYVYDPDRVLFPMRRSGGRGEGRWKRITWDEAYHEIASRLSSLMNRGEMAQAVFDLRDENPLVLRFLDALGAPTVIDRSKTRVVNKRMAQVLTWGVDREVVDPSRSAYVLNFGSNPFENHFFHVGFAQRLVEGRCDRGTKLVTFDVRLSNTAASSDEYFFVKPGTDGLVALAMANVIMQERLYDAAFLGEWTNYPVNRLAAHLQRYTPEWAEAESGVHAAHIRRIAVEFARAKPAAVISGGGVSEHEHGVQSERSVLLLAAITGNVDRDGGCCLPRTFSVPEPAPAPRLERRTPFDEASSLASLVETRGRIGFYMTSFSNPAYDDPDVERTTRLLKDEQQIPFSVAFDTHLTESALVADLVLPAATYLESWGLVSKPSLDMVPRVGLRQPVVGRAAETAFLRDGMKMSSPPFEPLGEAVSTGDVCIELAKRMGGEVAKCFPFDTTQGYIERAISLVEGLSQAGGMDHLKRVGFWADPHDVVEYETYRRGGFDTPSGKLEVYSRRLERMGHEPLPTYEPAPARGKVSGAEFTLTTFSVHVHTGRTGNCKWLSEIVHHNPAWMNPQRAESMGIRNGDTIRISSPVGEIVTDVLLTQGVHPEVIAIPQGCGHWGWGKIARAEKKKSSDPDTDLLWWSRVGNGVHPNRIIPLATDPIAKGQAWHDTRVTVRKV